MPVPPDELCIAFCSKQATNISGPLVTAVYSMQNLSSESRELLDRLSYEYVAIK